MRQRDPPPLRPADPASPTSRSRPRRYRSLSEDFAYANQWLNERGYRADIPAALDFRTWLERTGAAQISAFPDSARTAGQDA
jgi:hypothetical protein